LSGRHDLSGSGADGNSYSPRLVIAVFRRLPVRNNGSTQTTPPLAEDRTLAADRNKEPPQETQLSSARIIGLILSQTTLITAALFYFGWIRTRASYGYFGVDTSLLGYGVSDYLLRSTNSAFPFVVLPVVAMLVGTALHRGLQRLAARGARWPVRVLPRLAAVLGSLALGFAAVSVVAIPLQFAVGAADPYLLSLGAAAGLWAAHARASLSPDPRTRPDAVAVAQRTALLILVLVGYFWAISVNAERVGTELGHNRARRLVREPVIVVFSTQPLGLSGTGVSRTTLGGQSDGYRYRYDGLRLLVAANGKYFLLPALWTHGNDRVFVVADNDAIRIDVGAH
jgi:hypothetical protein